MLYFFAHRSVKKIIQQMFYFCRNYLKQIMYIQPYTVSIPPMDYELLKKLSEKFGWIVEPNTELEIMLHCLNKKK